MRALVLLARAARDPRRAYQELIRRLTYLWAPRFTSAIRKRWVILTNPHAEIAFGKYCRLDPGFSLHMPDGGRFIAGTAVHFRRGFRAEISAGGSVTIGDVCVFSYYSLIQCSTSIEIGDRAMFGQSSMVVDGNHRLKDVSTSIFGQGFDFRPLKIGSDVTTLTKVTVINDIGHKSVVAANSVVNKPVPAYCMAGGVPARIIDYFGPPELEPPEWSERRAASGEAAPQPRPGRLEVSGHSIALGGGVSAFEHRFTTRLAVLLDAEEVNRSVAGAIACWHETGADPGDGGYARVLQRFTRRPQIGARHPDGLAALVYFGLNDLAACGPDSLDSSFRHALRTAVSRHRAVAVFEESDPSVSYTGSWSSRSAEGDCSGEAVIETAGPEAGFEVLLPEDFPGGTVALGFLARPGEGAVHTFAVDGQPAGELDTRGITEPHGHRLGAVMRLSLPAAGTHRITCHVSDGRGRTGFDYWQLEPDPGPPVLLPLAYVMRDFSAYDGWAHRPNEASVTALNETIREVAAEFGQGVLVLDTEQVMRGSPRLLSSAGTYPNDDGHAALAAAGADALGRLGSLAVPKAAERPMHA